MNKMQKGKRNWIIAAIFGIMVAIIAFGGLSQSYAAEPYDSIGQYEKIQKTEKGVLAYKKESLSKNVSLTKEKMEKISSTITFTKPLSSNEVISYVKLHNLDVVQIQARALQGDTRITISSIYGNEFDMISKEQLGKYPNSKFVGYTDIYAKIHYSDIDGIQKDKKTFILDCGADEYFGGNKEKNGDKRNKQRKGNNRYAHALTWTMEDLGMMGN